MSSVRPSSRASADAPALQLLESLQACYETLIRTHGHVHAPSWVAPSLCGAEIDPQALMQQRGLSPLLLAIDRAIMMSHLILTTTTSFKELGISHHPTLACRQPVAQSWGGETDQHTDWMADEIWLRKDLGVFERPQPRHIPALACRALCIQRGLDKTSQQLRDVKQLADQRLGLLAAREEEVMMLRDVLKSVCPHTGRDLRTTPTTRGELESRQHAWKLKFEEIRLSAEQRRLTLKQLEQKDGAPKQDADCQTQDAWFGLLNDEPVCPTCVKFATAVDEVRERGFALKLFPESAQEATQQFHCVDSSLRFVQALPTYLIGIRKLLDSMAAERDEAVSKARDIQARMDTIDEEMEAKLNETRKNLHNEHESLVKKLRVEAAQMETKFGAEAKKLSKELVNIRRINQKLEMDLQDAATTRKALEQRLQDQEKRRAEAEELASERQKQIETLTHRAVQSKARIKDIHMSLQSSEAECRKLDEQLLNTKHKLDETQAAYEKLQDDHSHLISDLQRARDAELEQGRRMKELRQDAEALKIQLDASVDDAQSKARKIQLLQADIVHEKKQVKEKDSLIASLQAKIDDLRSAHSKDKDAASSVVARLQSEVESISDERDSLLRQLEAMTATTDHQKEELEKLQSEYDALKREHEAQAAVGQVFGAGGDSSGLSRRVFLASPTPLWDTKDARATNADGGDTEGDLYMAKTPEPPPERSYEWQDDVLITDPALDRLASPDRMSPKPPRSRSLQQQQQLPNARDSPTNASSQPAAQMSPRQQLTRPRQAPPATRTEAFQAARPIQGEASSPSAATRRLATLRRERERKRHQQSSW